MLKITNNHSGYLLVFALVFTAVFLIALTGLIGYAQINVGAEQRAVYRQSALHLAEAGIDRAIKQLNDNANYTGEADLAVGEGSLSTSLTTIDQYSKRIVSTASVPYGSDRVATQRVVATAYIDTETLTFAYGVQSGNGGFNMGNNSVVNGNIYANGSVTGDGTITGDVTVAAGSAASADQSWYQNNVDFLFGNSNDRKSVAQSFTPSTADILTRATFYIKKIGNPGNITFRLLANDNGSPSKTVLATGSISATLVTESYSFIETTLDTNPALTAGQTYWLMLTVSADSNNYYSWAIDTSDNYLNNTGKYTSNWNSGSPNWALGGGDLNFETFLGGVVYTLAGVTVNGTARAAEMTSCTVGGDAYYETTNTCVVNGQEFPNTPALPSVPFPISNSQINDWQAIAEAGGIIPGNHTITNGATETLGPIKIAGDLEVSNNSFLYITGPIWVEGDINFYNNVAARIDTSLGNNGTVIIANYPSDPNTKGIISISNNAIIDGNGLAGSFPLVISMYQGAGNAIDLNNNADNAILFAPNGTLTVSNNASVKEIIANKINMSNNSVVNYDTGLQSAAFASGPGGAWAFLRGSYAIVP